MKKGILFYEDTNKNVAIFLSSNKERDILIGFIYNSCKTFLQLFQFFSAIKNFS